MAVYKIFPTKDASIYSNYPTKNTGIDEILDISLYTSIEEVGEVSRALLAFSNTEIADIISNKIDSADYKAYLKLYLANASSIPLEYKLYCYPISGSWNMGTGRAANVPETSDGVSWKFRDVSGGAIFTSSVAEATNAYNGTNVGGGTWYTGSNLIATQSFDYTTDKDIKLDVTNAISSGYYHNGFIIKHSGSLEFNASYSFETKYFSTDTHTIYSPCLEFRWDDYTSSIGSLSTISSDSINISLSNNKGEFQEDTVNRFRVNVRDKFPTRTFQTSSIYLNNKVLPASSYYAVKDIKTEEFVIDFDTTFTKLSADSKGNYFDLYMNGLQPERYYQILIKSVISGSTVVHEDNNYFKVIR
jgi:hypothetical protein